MVVLGLGHNFQLILCKRTVAIPGMQRLLFIEYCSKFSFSHVRAIDSTFMKKVFYGEM